MLDFGKAGVLIALAILALSARSATKDLVLTGKIEFSNLLLFVLLYQMVHWGVFYFRQSSTNFYLIGMLLIIIVFKWFGKSPLPWPRLRIVRALM
jgi:hypothetical protein